MATAAQTRTHQERSPPTQSSSERTMPAPLPLSSSPERVLSDNNLKEAGAEWLHASCVLAELQSHCSSSSSWADGNNMLFYLEAATIKTTEHGQLFDTDATIVNSGYEYVSEEPVQPAGLPQSLQGSCLCERCLLVLHRFPNFRNLLQNAATWLTTAEHTTEDMTRCATRHGFHRKSQLGCELSKDRMVVYFNDDENCADDPVLAALLAGQQTHRRVFIMSA